ncbi:VOC family protein [Natrialba taiwanensis]|uniref:Glyoxalase/bleomycin resistance protein/dioxygenase n=1 Tax=Natrialba taiwanensis DSM 12281 TaxID=1230458 RepID=M0ACD0_9EURY|nr:VOC family protein [Natrialba taiwanensis]ELY96425.1 glyoxalase/bleomycin resistance protein/dioxygenase [Natrialba taiwanensis DSM 12281]
MTDGPPVPDTTRIGRVALDVTELEAMVEFYRDVVGLTVRTRTGTTATLGTVDAALLVLEQNEDAPPRQRDEAGLFHTAFKVPTREALGAALDRLRDRWTLTGASDHYVSEALYCRDPEDNGVEIYWDKPRTEWPRNDDETIAIGTIPLELDEVAAASNGAASAPPETSIGHVHLEVSSLPAARAFYGETLGLRVQTAMESALFLAAGDYHHHLGVNTWNARTQPVTTRHRGVAWFEFSLPDQVAVDSVRRRLAETDHSVTELDGEDGIAVADPDGITVRFRTR